MNHLPSSHDGPDDGMRPELIERHLRQLQPRPPRVDIDAVMSAAREANTPDNLAAPNIEAVQNREAVPQEPVEDSRKVVPAPSSPRGPLATIAVSWACGAIAGALITCLWLMPGSDEPQVRQAIAPVGETQIQTSDTQTRGTERPPTIADSRPVEEGLETQGDRDEQRDTPVWSRSEWLVAAQLSRLGRRQLDGESPMMADNYLRLGTPITQASLTEFPSVGKRPIESPGSTLDASPLMTRPNRLANPDLLLQELLGSDPAS